MTIRSVVCRVIFITLTSLSSISTANASECKELSATGNSEYPPYLWRENNNNRELQGAIDFIISEIGTRLNLTINLKHVGAWSRAQEEVKSGNIDMIAGAFYSTPRSQWMAYIDPPFVSTKSVVWQNKDKKFNYSDKQDLVGKLGATVIHNSFGQEFDEFLSDKLNIDSVASLEQALMMLSFKRVDYVLYEKNPGIAYATQLGLADNIEPLSPPVSSEGLYLTISHKSKCNTRALRDALAKVIQEMTDDGYMDKALKMGFALRKND